MSRVSELVESVDRVPPAEAIHQQTVKIPQWAHQKLRALAEYANRSKSSLAADLLVAAIEDALDAVPLEPSTVVGNMAPMTQREYVRWRADQFLEQFTKEYEAWPWDRGRTEAGGSEDD